MAAAYIVLVMPVVACLAFRTPPFQSPDEDSQFLRAVQVAQFGIAAGVLPNGLIGGRLPAGADKLAHGFADLHFQRRVVISSARLEVAGRTDWGAAKDSTFANTAIYPPIFYLPAAIAVRMARVLHAHVLTGLYLARLATGLLAVALSSAAIAMAPAGALLLLFLLSMPMTVFLYASCSQDALVIACAGFAASWMARLSVRDRPDTVRWCGVAALIGLLGAAKAPYLVLGLLPWIRAGRTARQGSRGLVILAIPFVIGIGWLVFGAAPVMVPGQSRLQLDFLARHPLTIPKIAFHTLERCGPQLCQQFIGVLGWLDILLPEWFYHFAGLSAGIFLLAEGMGRSSSRIQGGRTSFLTAFVLSLSAAAVFLALYLTWTPLAGMVVGGAQGRYFIPIALFAVLIIPTATRRRPAAAFALAVLWLAASGAVTLDAVTAHYVLATPS